ncbi:hypothetical protein [Moorena producens]|uniref:hypothetical protein n=1 Tax=Moorena producens TaxID=1155739 RepID=UPI003C779230
MKIENLENLQEITIDNLSSVEGGGYLFTLIDEVEPRIPPKSINNITPFDELVLDIYPKSINNINLLYDSITLAKGVTPLPRKCYTNLPFPNKGEKVIPLSERYRGCPAVVSIL